MTDQQFTIRRFFLEQFISAEPAAVWKHLTNPELMNRWMSDNNDLAIISDWKENGGIQIKGSLSGNAFSNEGTITKMQLEKVLRYDYVNSLSFHHYKIEKNDSVEFVLQPVASGTKLTFHCETGYTEIEEKHLRLYWGATLTVLKENIERGVGLVHE